jgi:hypothetical protein
VSESCTHLDQVADVTPSSEGWWFCYLDELTFLVGRAPSFAHP